MIYYDVTKMAGARQKSGLTRVSSRLREELGAEVREVTWVRQAFAFADEPARKVEFKKQDWLLTVELFSCAERPGFREWMDRHECRTAAFFYDAIPLRFPHVSWPQSVQRHPGHMKMLADFDQVFAISKASQEDLTGFWRWQGVAPRALVSAIEFGADFDGSARVTTPPSAKTGARPQLLCVGIIEPRKNQGFLLDACEALWRDGVDFDLHIVGRVNPHFGQPLERRFKHTQRREPRFHFHEAASDATLKKLYREAHAVVLPTQAEGCGLPLLEALWHGVPCVCSDLPVLRENSDGDKPGSLGGGGCLTAAVNDLADWQSKLRTVLTDGMAAANLARAAQQRILPRWADSALLLLAALSN